MIPVTYEPMEGVAVDVKDHARWIHTHGEMISLDLHGAKEPTRWMLRPQPGQRQDRGVCIGEKEDVL